MLVDHFSRPLCHGWHTRSKNDCWKERCRCLHWSCKQSKALTPLHLLLCRHYQDALHAELLHATSDEQLSVATTRSAETHVLVHRGRVGSRTQLHSLQCAAATQQCTLPCVLCCGTCVKCQTPSNHKVVVFAGIACMFIAYQHNEQNMVLHRSTVDRSLTLAATTFFMASSKNTHSAALALLRSSNSWYASCTVVNTHSARSEGVH